MSEMPCTDQVTDAAIHFKVSIDYDGNTIHYHPSIDVLYMKCDEVWKG